MIYIAPGWNTYCAQTRKFKGHKLKKTEKNCCIHIYLPLPLFFSPPHLSSFHLPSPPLSHSRSTMFPANLLLLMVLLLPQASSGRQGGDTSEIDHDRVSPTPSSLLPPPAGSLLEPSLAQTIQSLLLSRLGLQSQPDPRRGVPVPRYLLDLYRFHQQQFHLLEDPSFSFPSHHIQQANTVRSFHHTGKIPGTSWPHAVKFSINIFNCNCWRMSKDLVSVSRKLFIHSAEVSNQPLMIYKATVYGSSRCDSLSHNK